MSDDEYRPARLFTIEEANAMLPLVRAITRDMVQLAKDVVERQQRVEYLKAGRDIERGDPYSDELAQSLEDLEQDKERLRDYVIELRELGVEPKGAVEGLVDFPAMVDGQLVLLCWKYDEPEVLYWHTLEGGFAGRQPLTVSALGEEGSEARQAL
jgi:hypothetical protein